MRLGRRQDGAKILRWILGAKILRVGETVRAFIFLAAPRHRLQTRVYEPLLLSLTQWLRDTHVAHTLVEPP